jgi:hypothetical protein
MAARSKLPLASVRPMSPRNDVNIPPNRVTSNTQVIATDTPLTYGIVDRARLGIPLDMHLLTEDGQETITVGRNTAMMIPGSSQMDGDGRG